jgi:glycosyltransferase involved in cell wall biosynthesis
MKKVIVRAPALSFSGYGEHARFVLRALRTREDLFDIYLLNTDWGQMSWLHEDNEERRWIDSLIEKTIPLLQKKALFDISVQVTIPNEWEMMAPINIGVTAGTETNRISPAWIEKSSMMNKIIVVSEHAKHGFINTSYEARNEETGQVIKSFKSTTPVDVVNYPVKSIEPKEIDLELETDFNFLVAATWCPRKNLENTIQWFTEEFIDNKNAGLVLKIVIKNGSVIDREFCRRRIKDLISKYENRKCKIYLLHGDLSDEEMHGLYTNPKIKCLINLAHGEGFGLPIFEAAYSGLPVICPDWGGQVDFLYAPKKNKKGKIRNRPHFLTVDYQLKPIQKQAIWKDILMKGSMWCFPNQGSYKMRLREVYKSHRIYKKRAAELKNHVLERFTEKKQFSEFVSSIEEFIAPSAAELDVDEMFNSLVEELQK